VQRLFAAFGLALATSAVAQPADKSFNSRGVQIRYIEAGAGDPVLLIHGYNATSNSTDCGENFDWMIDRLREQGFTGPMVKVGFYSGDKHCE